LAQILAEKMKMDVNRIYVVMEVNTQTAPDHWKTAASRTIMLIGRSVISAADDAISQLKKTAAIVLKCNPEDLILENEKISVISDVNRYVAVKDIALGYTYPNGNSIEGQVIGRGKYIVSNISTMNKETGKGVPGTEWTMGAQGVEVEFDRANYTYKLIKAISVIDAGKVINLQAAIGQVAGGMALGLSFASREAFLFSNLGVIQNDSLRNYKPMRYGENPEYIVGFIETPNLEGPYGARGVGEYGVIGMPSALANSLSIAANVQLNQLPLMPELIWKTKKGGQI